MKRSKIMAVVVAAAMTITGFADVPFAQLSPLTVTAQAASAEWSGEFATDFAGGSGTAEDPFLVATGEQLALIANELNNKSTKFQDVYFKLKNDIVLNTGFTTQDKPIEWTPIGYSGYGFQGVFDGDGHSIIGLYFNNSSNYRGLFGNLGRYGVVKNVVMKDGLIKGANDYTGSIAGYNYGYIYNCTNYNTIDASVYRYIGGIAGTTNAKYQDEVEESGTIENCYNYASVKCSGTTDVGGVVGLMQENATLKNCKNYGTITSTMESTGGVAGSSTYGKLYNCMNYADVTSTKPHTGGVIGYDGVTIVAECVNTANVTGKNLTGGVAGYSSATGTNTIRDSYNTGNVVGTSEVGGIAGASFDTNKVTNCYNTGSVTGNYNVGGVIGYADAKTSYGSAPEYTTVTSCYNKGVVTANTTDTCRAGGVIGFSDHAQSLTSYNLGKVTGQGTATGGFMGYSINSTATSCYNAGQVVGKENYTGGFVGYVKYDITLDSCYNIGDVTGVSYVGGLWSVFVDSTSSSSVNDCYVAGTVAGSGTNIYPVGEVPTTATIETTYYDKDVCTVSHYSNSKFAKTTDQLTAATVIDDLAFNVDNWSKKNNTAVIKYYPDLTAIATDAPCFRLFLPPSTVKATAGNAVVTLSWSKVDGATTYRVRRNDGTAWTTLANVTTTSYKDTTVTNGTKYSYAVYAYNGVKWSDASAIVTATPVAYQCVPPATVKATAGDKAVTVTWSKVAGATAYRVRRNDGKAWATLGNVTTTSYKDTAVTNGTKYTYGILAQVNGTWSAASTLVAATPYACVAPATVKATAGDKTVTVTWSKVAGATAYRVRRNDGKAWATLANVTATSYKDTAVTNGTKYTYGILAQVNGTWSAASTLVAATPVSAYQCVPPTGVKATGDDGVITVTWNAVEGATAYRVRRNDGSAWATLANVTATSYKDTAVTNGTKYTYGIFAQVNGTWSAASALVTATPEAIECIPPASVTIKSESGKISLEWSAVNGATKYRVRRSDGSGWVNLASVATTCYVDSSVTNGTNYVYGIFAYVEGAWSAASALVQAKPAAVIDGVANGLTITTTADSITLSWDVVDGAEKYRVRRSDGVAWATKQTSAKTTFVDTDVVAGTTYKYSIYCYSDGAFGVPSSTVAAIP